MIAKYVIWKHYVVYFVRYMYRLRTVCSGVWLYVSIFGKEGRLNKEDICRW